MTDLCCPFSLLGVLAANFLTILAQVRAQDGSRGERIARWLATVLALVACYGVLYLFATGYSHAECSPCAEPEDVAREAWQLRLVVGVNALATAITLGLGLRARRRGSPIWSLAWVMLWTLPGWLTVLLLLTQP